MSKRVPPHVDPRASLSPAAMKYAQGLENRVPPNANMPRPPIPRLDLAPEEGAPPMTLADHAQAQRQYLGTPLQNQPQMPTTPGSPGGIVQPQSGLGGQPYSSESGFQLEAGDILHPSAYNDPAYENVPGAQAAVNNVQLAQKYGIMRNGIPISGATVRGARPGKISTATEEGLRAIAEFNAKRESASNQAAEASATRDSDNSLGGVAQGIAGGKQAAGGIKEFVERAEEMHDKRQLDSFEYERLVSALETDILNNEEERKAVEERLQPLNLGELINRGYIQQRVPVVPGLFEPTFITYDGNLDLAVKRYIFNERFEDRKMGLEQADRYYIDRFSVMALACGVNAINEVQLGQVTDNHGEFNQEMFLAKFKRITRLPFHMIVSLAVHFRWFDIRVKRLFRGSNLKNS